jgi:lysophospholipid acyltransferase (LPLAT)-like uncharacterized protein
MELRFVLGYLLGWFVRLWAFTWRVRLCVDSRLELGTSRPLVFVFWHGTQMALTAARRRRRTCVLVSWSKDGWLQSGVLSAMGMRVVRGSSSGGGARGLRAIVHRLHAGHDAAFAVDGPRGPRGMAKPGAATAAELSGALCVPLGCAAERELVLARTWDAFRIPLPFSRVVVWAGPPVCAPSVPEGPSWIGSAIQAANARAEAELSGARDHKGTICRLS